MTKYNHNQGFSLIEILLTSMFIAIVFIPLMTSLSRIQNRYLSLKSHFYAQLITQSNMEIMTNILQSRNPDSPPPGDYSLYKMSIHDKIDNFDSIKHNNVVSISPPNIDFLSGTITVASPPQNTTINGINYESTIFAQPLCRNTTTGQIINKPPNRQDCTDSSQVDQSSIEIVSQTNWTPVGGPPSQYQLKSIFTNYAITTTP
jgi:hypothetical protein